MRRMFSSLIVGILVGMFVAPPALFAADWFVVPYGDGTNGTKNCTAPGVVCDGTSITNAWNRGNHQTGVGAVNFGVMNTGDRLFVCGLHDKFPQNIFRPNKSGVTVSGFCPGDPATLIKGFVALRDVDKVTVEGLMIIGDDPQSQGIALVNTNGSKILNNELEHLRNPIIASRDHYANDILVKGNKIKNSPQGLSLYASNTSNPALVKKNWIVEDNLFENIFNTPGIDNHDQEAIGVQGCDNCVFRNNTIRGAMYGIDFWVCENGILRDVSVVDNTIEDIYGGPASKPSWAVGKECGNGDQQQNNVVEGNTIERANIGVRWHATVTNPTFVLIAKNKLTDVSTPFETSGNVSVDCDNTIDGQPYCGGEEPPSCPAN